MQGRHLLGVATVALVAGLIWVLSSNSLNPRGQDYRPVLVAGEPKVEPEVNSVGEPNPLDPPGSRATVLARMDLRFILPSGELASPIESDVVIRIGDDLNRLPVEALKSGQVEGEEGQTATLVVHWDSPLGMEYKGAKTFSFAKGTTVDVRLESVYATVTGRVLSGSQPLIDELVRGVVEGERIEVYTNQRGRYRIDFKTEGTARLSTGHPRSPTAKASIRVSRAKEQSVDLVLAPGTLTIEVLLPGGEPAPPGVIAFLGPAAGAKDLSSLFSPRADSTDQLGINSFESIRPGTYRLDIGTSTTNRSWLKNSDASPLIMQVEHDGSHMAIRAHLPRRTLLKVIAKPAFGEKKGYNVFAPFWIRKRDGNKEIRLTEYFTTALDLSWRPDKEFPVPPGEVEIIVGGNTTGYGTATAVLVEGQENVVEVTLDVVPLHCIALIHPDSAPRLTDVFIFDEKDDVVVKIPMNMASEHVDSDGNQVLSVGFNVPHAGRYRLIGKLGGKTAIEFDQITVREDGDAFEFSVSGDQL
jgi:hypothetical protein